MLNIAAAAATIPSWVSTLLVMPEIKLVTSALITGLLVFLPLSYLDSLPSSLALSSQIIVFCISSGETFLSTACFLIRISWKVLQSSLAISFATLYSFHTSFNLPKASLALRYWPEFLPSLIENFLIAFLLVRIPSLILRILCQ